MSSTHDRWLLWDILSKPKLSTSNLHLNWTVQMIVYISRHKLSNVWRLVWSGWFFSLLARGHLDALTCLSPSSQSTMTGQLQLWTVPNSTQLISTIGISLIHSWRFYDQLSCSVVNAINNTACMQVNVNDSTWKEACVLIDSISENNGPDDKVSVKGCKRLIFQHQLIAVYWMLKHERGECGGGFLEDESSYDKVSLHYVLYVFLTQSPTKSLVITDDQSTACHLSESLSSLKSSSG